MGLTNSQNKLVLFNQLYELLKEEFNGGCWDNDDPYRETCNLFCSSCIVKKLMDDLKEVLELD